MRKLVSSVLSLGLLMTVPGCSYIWGEPAGGADEAVFGPADDEDPLGGYTRDELAGWLDATWYGETLVSNDAFVVRDAPCYEATASPDGGETLVLSFSCPAEEAGLREGQVLIGTEGRGFLRRVDELQTNGNVAVARTSPAGFEDVWYVADFATAVKIDPMAEGLVDDAMREVELSLPQGWTFSKVLYDGSGGDAETGWSAQLDAEGLLYVVPTLYMDADIGIETSWGWPPVSVAVDKVEAGVVFEATAEIVLHGNIEGHWHEDGSTQLFTFGRDFVFPGPAGIPIVAGMDFTVELTWEADASASLDGSIGAHADARFGLGGRYEDGTWESLDDWDWDAAMIGPELDLEGTFSARAGIKITASANVYGGALEFGASGEPWIGPELELDCDAVDWKLQWGVDTSAHVGGLWGAVPDYEFDIVDFGPYELASGEVDLPLDFLPDPDCAPEDEAPELGGEDSVSSDDAGVGAPWWEEAYGDVDILEPGEMEPSKWYGFDRTPDGDGYWMVDVDGRVEAFGGAGHHGDFVSGGSPVEALVAHPGGAGYWLLAADATVYPFGSAQVYDSNTSDPITAAIAAFAAHPSGQGYWTVGADGVVHAYGAAERVGQPDGLPGRRMAVDIAPTPSGAGYWILGFDGVVYSFGDAAYAGDADGGGGWSAFTGMHAHPSGEGYWLTTADGRVFAFGGAPHLGDLAGETGQAVMDIVGTPTGEGYWLATWDGEVHPFGDALWHGDPAKGAGEG